jgi:phosphatidylinositol alpha-1,6-mannosyltransferase
MKILVLLPSFHGPERGGVQLSGRLAWEALRENHACRALAFGNPPPSVERGMVYARTRAGAALRVGGLVREPSDVLIWHIGLLKLLPFARTRNARVSLFLHGVEAWNPDGPLVGRLLARVDRFFCNSSFTWDRFIRAHPALRGRSRCVVPLGIGRSLSRPPPAPEEPPAALMIGRLTEGYKGHEQVVRAWPRVTESLPGARLWIVGEGPLLAGLRRAADRTRHRGEIRFWGRLDEEKKEELILKSRALLMPSRGEGFGLVYAEAMRLGRPCLVSGADGGVEVVRPPEAGLAADPGDPERLADGILRLLQDGPRWRDWSEAARRRYEGNFTARLFQERLVRALETA